MALTETVTVNGVNFEFPAIGDEDWGEEVTAWAIAISASSLYKNGGLFTLAAELDFGANFGVKSLYYKSRTANVASDGEIRLARADEIAFRNEANSADLILGVNASNQLTFGGVALGLSDSNTFVDTETIDFTVDGTDVSAIVIAGSIGTTELEDLGVSTGKLAAGAVVNSKVGASAAIEVSKLEALTADRALQTSGTGVVEPSAVTSTELGFLDGVTSAIQTQLDAKPDSGDIADADIDASAAIALSKLAALTANRALETDASGVISASAVTDTELNYLDGVTSAIQGQIDGKVSEANVSGTKRSYTKQQNFGEATLMDGANVSWNLDNAQAAKVTLGGNRTLDNPTNLIAGGTYVLRVIQDATGSRTLSYGSAYDWGDDGAPTLSTAANSIDILTFVSDGTKMYGAAKLGFG